MKDILEFATPEEVGISSRDVAEFINDIREQSICIHSLIVIRHGKVCAEVYAPPFNKERLHRAYSSSKTFSSMALGILVGEGRVSLDDKIKDFFPEYLPESLHEWTAELTLRDALTMSSLFEDCPYDMKSPDFIYPIFNSRPAHPSSMVYNYDTACSCAVSTVVEKVSGLPMLEFLKERALLEIGFSSDATCVKMPQGNDWGGSGVLCTTRDLARFALLVFNEGYANGKQLLPREYVREAVSRRVDNSQSGHPDFLMGNGYGYQVWRTMYNGYAFWGMGSQCVFCFPDNDMILVTNGDTQGASFDYSVCYPFLYDLLKRTKKFDRLDSLPRDPEGERMLEEAKAGFSLPIPKGDRSSQRAKSINGRLFKRIGGREDVVSFSVTLDDERGVLSLNTVRGKKELVFGIAEFEAFEFPEVHYSGRRIGEPLGRGYRALGAGVWVEEDKLAIKTNIVDDFFGNMYTVISFKEDLALISTKTYAEDFLDEYSGEIIGRAEK